MQDQSTVKLEKKKATKKSQKKHVFKSFFF